MKTYFAKLYSRFGGNTKVEIHLSSYAKKPDILKNCIHVGTSKVFKKLI